jgi:arogenate dehydrogenase (NADP+)
MRQTPFLFLPLLVCGELFLCSALANISSPAVNNSNKFDRLDQHRLEKLQTQPGASTSFSMSMSTANGADDIPSPAGRLEELKQQEATLANQLAAIRIEKISALRSRPLTIGIIGFGRFGQFIARTFAKHGKIVVTSRSDYSAVASGMGVTYIPLDQPDEFLNQGLDVVIVATSILSFESTILKLASPLQRLVDSQNKKGPLVVDVLSVKEHARQTMLKQLPEECDILCTHPMFGPDSGRNGWQNLNFVYEKTRVDKVIFDPSSGSEASDSVVDHKGQMHCDAHVESMDRIERFLSIWEEEGCRMVPMSCKAHDAFAANSQFITHLMGRILGAQGLVETPIDTKGFESVLRLVDSTTADSFDLFYGLYKFNQKNSMETIKQLRAAMDDVCANLKRLEDEDIANQQTQTQEQEQAQQPM